MVDGIRGFEHLSCMDSTQEPGLNFDPETLPVTPTVFFSLPDYLSSDYLCSRPDAFLRRAPTPYRYCLGRCCFFSRLCVPTRGQFRATRLPLSLDTLLNRSKGRMTYSRQPMTVFRSLNSESRIPAAEPSSRSIVHTFQEQ